MIFEDERMPRWAYVLPCPFMVAAAYLEKHNQYKSELTMSTNLRQFTFALGKEHGIEGIRFRDYLDWDLYNKMDPDVGFARYGIIIWRDKKPDDQETVEKVKAVIADLKEKLGIKEKEKWGLINYAHDIDTCYLPQESEMPAVFT